MISSIYRMYKLKSEKYLKYELYIMNKSITYKENNYKVLSTLV